MKLIFICGPYTAATHLEREGNILRAREAGAKVAALGAYPFIPHSNTAHLDAPPEYGEALFYDGCLELLRRSDALFMLEGWERAAGAVREREEALMLEIPVFTKFDYLRQWVEQNDSMKFGDKPPVWVNVPGASLIVGMGCSRNKIAQDVTVSNILDPDASYDVQVVRWMKRGLWSPEASRDN